MSRKTFTVPGTNDTRTSDRDYTHALVGTYDWDFEERQAAARNVTPSKTDLSNYKYHQVIAGATAGESYSKYEPGYKFNIDQEMIDRSKSYIAQYPNIEAVLEASCKASAERIAQGRKMQAENPFKFTVLRWSMSAINAQRAAGSREFKGYYKDLRVVEVVRTK